MAGNFGDLLKIPNKIGNVHGIHHMAGNFGDLLNKIENVHGIHRIAGNFGDLLKIHRMAWNFGDLLCMTDHSWDPLRKDERILDLRCGVVYFCIVGCVWHLQGTFGNDWNLQRTFGTDWNPLNIFVVWHLLRKFGLVHIVGNSWDLHCMAVFEEPLFHDLFFHMGVQLLHVVESGANLLHIERLVYVESIVVELLHMAWICSNHFLELDDLAFLANQCIVGVSGSFAESLEIFCSNLAKCVVN